MTEIWWTECILIMEHQTNKTCRPDLNVYACVLFQFCTAHARTCWKYSSFEWCLIGQSKRVLLCFYLKVWIRRNFYCCDFYTLTVIYQAETRQYLETWQHWQKMLKHAFASQRYTLHAMHTAIDQIHGIQADKLHRQDAQASASRADDAHLSRASSFFLLLTEAPLFAERHGPTTQNDLLQLGEATLDAGICMGCRQPTFSLSLFHEGEFTDWCRSAVGLRQNDATFLKKQCR